MAREIEALRYMIEAVWDGDRAVGKAKQQLGQLGDVTEKVAQTSQRSWRTIGAAAAATGVSFAGMGLAARQAYQMLGEGADLARASDRFDKLAVSIGTTADALNNELKEATHGLISNAELVVGANDIMSGKLATTSDQVVRLATVTANLGWDMGVLAQTINNQSVLRLDNLGIAAEDVIPKFKELRDAGMETKQAFTEALLQAGEAKQELFGLGDGADDARASLDRLEVAWTNTNDAFKETLAAELASGLDDVTDSADNLGAEMISTATEVATATAGMLSAIIGLASVAQAVSEGRFDTGALWKDMNSHDFSGLLDYIQPQFGASKRTRGLGGGTVLVDSKVMGPPAPDGYYDDKGALEQNTTAIKRSRAEILDWKENMQTAADQQRFWRDGIEETTEALAGGGGGYGGGGLVGALLDSVEAMSMLSSASGDLFSRLRGAKEFNLAEELFSLGDKMGAGALDLAGFGVTAGLFDQARADELLGQSYLLQNAEQLLAQGMSLQEVWAAVSGQQENASALATEFFSAIDQTSAEATMLLDTEPSYSELDAFVAAVEAANPVMNITANWPSIPGAAAPEPRAIGGPVYAHEPYLVGERGPELFVPHGSGTVVPNDRLGGGGTVVINNYNREAAAISMALIGLARRGALV